MATTQAPQRPNAWLLTLGHGQRAAVGVRVLLQLIDKPTLYPVPATPAYCHHVIAWQDKLLPVLDLSVRAGGRPLERPVVGIIGYHGRPEEATRYAALLLSASPEAIQVKDEQACDLPPALLGWRDISISCFEREGSAIPILHLEKLCSRREVQD